MAVYSEIVGATNFKRKKYKVSGENAGTYVITIDTATKQKLVDGQEFTTDIEMNDLELANAIKQRSNLKGWRLAFEVSSGTTIMVGKVIGVIAQDKIGNIERTILSCLLSNGSFLNVNVNYNVDEKTFETTLTSLGLSGGGSATKYLTLENVDLSSGSTSVVLSALNYETATDTTSDVSLVAYLTSGTQSTYPLGEFVELRRISVSNEKVIFGATFDYPNENYIGYTISAIFTANSGRIVINETEVNKELGSGEYAELDNLTINGETFVAPKVVVNPTLDGNESEILGLDVSGTKYKMPSLSYTDNVVFDYGTTTDFNISGKYSSYNRCGKELTFVIACDISVDSALTSEVNLGTFASIPTTYFEQLIPSQVGSGQYLDIQNVSAFDSKNTSVVIPINLVKGSNNDISVNLDPTNLVVGSTYHIRYFVKFLLTNNLSGIDSVLENNSWSVIKEVFTSGNASAHWDLGDTKTDLGVDGTTRTFRIAHIGTIHNGKHGSFEQVGVDSQTYVWNQSSNTDDDSCYNNYNISNMRTTHLPSILLKYSTDLQASITDTTVQTAKNGNSATIVSTTDKLYLPAEKEIWTSKHYSRQEEFDILTTFGYYLTHTSQADHIKYENGTTTARYYWLRSPPSGYTDCACGVDTDGNWNYDSANYGRRVAPCFDY